MFLYTLEHLIPDGYDEIPTFASYHLLLPELHKMNVNQANYGGRAAGQGPGLRVNINNEWQM